MQKPARSDPGGRFLYSLSSVSLKHREEKAFLFVLDDGEELPELILCLDLVASGLWRMDLRLADDVGVEVRARLPEEFDEELSSGAFALPVLPGGEDAAVDAFQHRVGDLGDL